MPHMTIPSADKPAPRDLYQYSPEKLMEAILSPEATREFMRSPEKLETETSHDARGRRRTKVWATVIGVSCGNRLSIEASSSSCSRS